MVISNSQAVSFSFTPIVAGDRTPLPYRHRRRL